MCTVRTATITDADSRNQAMMSMQTLRRMAGATAPTRVDPARTALLLIDFQKEYYTGALPLPDGEAAAANAVQLVDCFRSATNISNRSSCAKISRHVLFSS